MQVIDKVSLQDPDLKIQLDQLDIETALIRDSVSSLKKTSQEGTVRCCDLGRLVDSIHKAVVQDHVIGEPTKTC